MQCYVPFLDWVKLIKIVLWQKNECNTPRLQQDLYVVQCCCCIWREPPPPPLSCSKNNGTALCVLEYLLQYFNCNICGEYLPLS